VNATVRLTDFNEIWHDDTADLYGQNFEFLKSQDGGGCHLKNHKNRDISATV